MRNLVVFSTFLGLVLGSLGCADDPEKGPVQEGNSAEHAAAGVVPGSYEDWCGEHQVPESQCTRCNPELTAAFQATGDWCSEHGLPESQCVACNPEIKIERPPKPEAR